MDETLLQSTEPERALIYRLLRYTPNLVRDEWVNIGVLLYDPDTGERRLRMMEDQEEFARIRRLHPGADEELLRKVRDDLEDRFQNARDIVDGGWQRMLAKWDDTLSNALQLAPQKGVLAADLDLEMERLYADHVAPQRSASRIGAPGSRATMRNYCSQVWRQAHLWGRVQRAVRASEYTFPGDPMRLDYSYRRNGTRGFVQTLSVSRSPGDSKLYAYTAARIAVRAPFKSEFAAVTDIELKRDNERHRFVEETLRDAGIEPVPLDHFAVWVAKLKPLLQ